MRGVDNAHATVAKLLDHTVRSELPAGQVRRAVEIVGEKVGSIHPGWGFKKTAGAVGAIVCRQQLTYFRDGCGVAGRSSQEQRFARLAIQLNRFFEEP